MPYAILPFNINYIDYFLNFFGPPELFKEFIYLYYKCISSDSLLEILLLYYILTQSSMSMCVFIHNVDSKLKYVNNIIPIFLPIDYCITLTVHILNIAVISLR